MVTRWVGGQIYPEILKTLYLNAPLALIQGEDDMNESLTTAWDTTVAFSAYSYEFPTWTL